MFRGEPIGQRDAVTRMLVEAAEAIRRALDAAAKRARGAVDRVHEFLCLACKRLRVAVARPSGAVDDVSRQTLGERSDGTRKLSGTSLAAAARS
jgi:hypothetical protein